nr:pyridoxamine 5'-phosphate oxidase family protein [Mycolicibacterium sphagni]
MPPGSQPERRHRCWSAAHETRPYPTARNTRGTGFLRTYVRYYARRVTKSWRAVQAAVPEFADRVQALFDAHKHKTIATIRADGSPRISGIETAFEGGELTFGSMPNARKGADLRRDPRFALHTATVDPVEGEEAQWPGEAKIAGRAIHSGAITNGPDGDLFRADITEVVLTHLNDAATLLVIEWWTPEHGLRKTERE